MLNHIFFIVLCSLFSLGHGVEFTNTTDASATVHWLEGKPAHNFGTTFGLPWPAGKFPSNSTTFSAKTSSNEQVALKSWISGQWADGTVKWSSHAFGASDAASEAYTITAQTGSAPIKRQTTNTTQSRSLLVTDTSTLITVNTGKLTVSFPTTGRDLISKIQTASGKTIGENGRLILHSQSGVAEHLEDRGNSSIQYLNFASKIQNVTVNSNTVRALVTVNGIHQSTTAGAHEDWLPFVIRFYLYDNSDSIRVVHSLIFDAPAEKNFITGVGIRFGVPLASEKAYNRHVRIAGVDGGLLSEAVQGITGLRRDPGTAVRAAQVKGETLPDISTWTKTVVAGLQWVPTWSDYSLSQLSSDGFTLKKRTKAGQGWINIPGGTRAGGLAYLGGSTVGGLAIGLRDFWKRYPSGLDISNAASDSGELTLWLYSPAAEPLDLRPYHDGLGQGAKNYTNQLAALDITYEDWEGGFNTPYGIARTSEAYIFGFEQTPTKEKLSEITKYVSQPPVLVATPERIHETKALGTYWSLPNNSSAKATEIESHLDFFFEFYKKQVEQRKWYGFLDYGDFMHTYDPDRHTWRYDIGGFAWDNSELSPDLWLWQYFLRTGRADVYRFAEALTRHTGEVDVYHLGSWKGLGTRHGIQHWGDSAKQARISQPMYRKPLFYLTGGDERIGELLDELLDVDKTYGVLDPSRKVRIDGWVPTPSSDVVFALGTDYSSLAASWLMAYERRGPRWVEAKSKLLSTLTSIAGLKNGFVTGSGLYSLTNSTLSPPPLDPNNTGIVSVSHLSAVFGLVEVVSETIQYLGPALPKGFKEAWLDYCYYFNASRAEQSARYGTSFGTQNLFQGHTRLAAYNAFETGNSSLAQRAWKDFFGSDGFKANGPWNTTLVSGADALVAVDEAAWLSTNEVAQYGLAAIQNLALIGDAL
ncbi:hypothetical protein Vi05172_g13358 [Venturia inaequalis]|nr:hypothetical protein Vi05172_g13358 [Venturia inaequalis]